jgi:pyruvate,orthophosphate dikinase
VARTTYQRFLPLNAELLEVCTAWQLRDDGTLNDHSDRAYDFGVLERLDRLHERIAPLVVRLADAVPRFAGYPERLAAALERIAGDRQWMASPRCDSYHTVWMQMHEDLLCAIGASRADEPEPTETNRGLSGTRSLGT